jgi:Na+/melibiose symporter-like transporter
MRQPEARTDRSHPNVAIAWRYGVGQLPISVYFGVSSLLLMPFMTTVLGVPAAIAGLAVMLPKFAAIAMDPMVGLWAERLPAKWRRQRRLLLASGLLASAAVVVLFRPAVLPDPNLTGLWMACAFAAANLALAGLSVSYLSAALDVAPSPDQRTVLMSWKVGFHMSGVLLGGLAPLLVAFFGGGRPGYAGMGVVIGLLSAVAVLVSYWGIRHVPVSAAPAKVARIGALWRVVSAPTFIRELALLYAVKYFANGVQYAAKAYFVLFIIDVGLPFLSLMVVSLTLTALVCQPVWVSLAGRIGKPRTLMLSTVGMGSAFALYAFLGAGDRAAAVALSVMQGFFAGGGALMTSALFLDSVNRYAEETGESQPSLLSGVWSAIEKAAFAMGVFALGVILDLLGFVPSTGLPAAQSSDVLMGVRLGMALIPAAGMVLSMILIARWVPAARPVRPG